MGRRRGWGTGRGCGLGAGSSVVALLAARAGLVRRLRPPRQDLPDRRADPRPVAGAAGADLGRAYPLIVSGRPLASRGPRRRSTRPRGTAGDTVNFASRLGI